MDSVKKPMYGRTYSNLTSDIATMLPNYHLSKPVLIVEIQVLGQFHVINQTEEVPGDA